ncbi:hypothetical protein [Kitasatospora sp. NPDC059571]|uniref:hypothetical protein n=1 Tax=Kitasatospora sp. NPDC059571 TaxID=3346871 RepID=UPI0036C9A833
MHRRRTASLGDPIHPLRKDYDKYRQGTIFHRYAGRTGPAGAWEIDDLGERLRRGAPTVDVSLAAVQDTVPAVRLVGDLEQLLARRRDALMAQLPTAHRTADTAPSTAAPIIVEARPQGERRRFTTADLEQVRQRQTDGEKLTADEREALERLATAMEKASKSFMTAFAAPASPDRRSPDQFRADADAYVAQLRRAVPGAITAAAVARAEAVRFEIRNPTDRFLAQLEVIVDLPAELTAVLPGRHRAPIEWPDPPPAYGSLTKFDIGMPVPPITVTIPPYGFRPAPVARRPEIESTAESTVVRFPAVDVRAHGHVLLDPLAVIANQGFAGTLTARWSATATNLDGRVENATTLRLSPLLLDVGELMGRTS